MIHIAILLKPYLDMILDGTKTVECRLTVQQRPPFEMIEPGDRIYFKQSAGPYRGMAIADHVLCEGNLTRRRLAEIKRDYNDLICGDAEYWRYKRNSRYATLIWLRDVQPTDHGPAIEPSQGIAWFTLESEMAWRRTSNADSRVPEGRGSRSQTTTGSRLAASSFFVEVTPGNLRNNTLYVRDVIDRFPKWTHGGKTKAEAGKPVTLMLYDGPTVETDIVTPRKLLRTRIWGTWFKRHGAKPGDRVIFTPLDRKTYQVGLARKPERRT